MTIRMTFTLSGNWNSILASTECAVKLRTIQIQTRLGTSLHTNSLLGQPPHFYHHKKDIFSISTVKSRGWASDQLTDSPYPCLELVSLAWDMKLDRERVPKPRHPVSLFIGFPTTPDSIAPPVPCFAPLTPPEKEGMDFFSPHSDLQLESKTNRPGFSIIPTFFSPSSGKQCTGIPFIRSTQCCVLMISQDGGVYFS